MSRQTDEPGQVTQLLRAAAEGDRAAFDHLLPLVYDHLRRAARRQMRGERPDHTLQTTALAHEAYLKLVDETSIEWQSRSHFLAIAARAMGQILIDHARRRNAAKRGGDWQRTSLSGEPLGVETRLDQLLALDEALERLDALDPRMRRVVECRFFGGMTEQEVADALDVTARTVQRDWAKARAWLHKELYRADG